MFLRECGGDECSRAEKHLKMKNGTWYKDARRTNVRQNTMNGSTLSPFTVGPWRIMALRPWMNVLWAAAMLLNPVSHVFISSSNESKPYMA